MIGALLALLACQLAGETLVRVLHVPLPGPVVGMLLLFVALRVRGSVPGALRITAQTLLGNLSLFFLPAGVGIMVYAALIWQAWLPLATTLVLSTLATLAITAWALQWFLRLAPKRTASDEPL